MSEKEGKATQELAWWQMCCLLWEAARSDLYRKTSPLANLRTSSMQREFAHCCQNARLTQYRISESKPPMEAVDVASAISEILVEKDGDEMVS